MDSAALRTITESSIRHASLRSERQPQTRQVERSSARCRDPTRARCRSITPRNLSKHDPGRDGPAAELALILMAQR